MSKTLSARQAELSQRRTLSSVPLVVLTTYTARDAETVDTVWYFTDRPLYYDYGNTGTVRDFEPAILRINELAVAMDHLPEPNSPLGQLTRPLDVVFRNAIDEAGAYLINRLRGDNLEFATVEVAQLLLDVPAGDRLQGDLSALVGDEHVVWYRGELFKVGDVDSAEFTVAFESVVPHITQTILNTPGDTDPRDIGKRANHVYGDCKLVPCHGVDVGAVSTLRLSIDDADLTVPISDTSRFPSSGNVKVGEEEISYTAKSADALVGTVVRGVGSTDAVAHGVGSTCVEIKSPAIFEAAAHEVNAIDLVYAKNPASGLLTRLISTTHYTADVADTGSELPGTWASIRISAAQFANIARQFEDMNTQPTGDQEVIVATMPQVAVTTETIQGSIGAPPWDSIQVFPSTLIINYEGSLNEDGVLMRAPTGVLDISNAIIIRWRIRVLALAMVESAVSGADVHWRAYLMRPPAGAGASDNDELFDVAVAAGVAAYSVTGVSAWKTPTATLQLSDFESSSDTVGMAVLNIVFHAGADGDAQVSFDIGGNACFLEIEVIPPLGINARTVAALAVGNGLELFADVKGYEVPAADTNYDASAGALIEKLPDIVRHYVVVRAGGAHADCDSTSWTEALTNLGSNKHNFVESELVLGDAPVFAQVMARLGFEGRTQVTQEEAAAGTVYKLLTANHPSASVWDFDASDGAISLFDGESEDGRDGDGIFTRWRLAYDTDRMRGDGSVDGFFEMLQLDPDKSDVDGITAANMATAEDVFGRRDHQGLAFVTVSDEDTAENVLGWLASESKRVAATARIRGVPWVESYAIELGDIRDAQLAWWTTSRDLRIVGYTKRWDDQLADIVGVEV